MRVKKCNLILNMNIPCKSTVGLVVGSEVGLRVGRKLEHCGHEPHSFPVHKIPHMMYSATASQSLQHPAFDGIKVGWCDG